MCTTHGVWHGQAQSPATPRGLDAWHGCQPRMAAHVFSVWPPRAFRAPGADSRALAPARTARTVLSRTAGTGLLVRWRCRRRVRAIARIRYPGAHQCGVGAADYTTGARDPSRGTDRSSWAHRI